MDKTYSSNKPIEVTENFYREYKLAMENFFCYNIGCHLCPANWNKYGKSAGPIRNVEMLELADALIVIINNNSRGSTHMLNIALKKGIPVFCKNISV